MREYNEFLFFSWKLISLFVKYNEPEEGKGFSEPNLGNRKKWIIRRSEGFLLGASWGALNYLLG